MFSRPDIGQPVNGCWGSAGRYGALVPQVKQPNDAVYICPLFRSTLPSLSLALPSLSPASQGETLFSPRNHLTHGRRARQLSKSGPVPAGPVASPLSLRTSQATYIVLGPRRIRQSIHTLSFARLCASGFPCLAIRSLNRQAVQYLTYGSLERHVRRLALHGTCLPSWPHGPRSEIVCLGDEAVT
ncbi:hypothetical protein LZ30DRAFT_738317 [Colletotrichum cereale]|nr:hypothetical protein LZ30DRAFT_738317 [Colletotrichum cereale]